MCGCLCFNGPLQRQENGVQIYTPCYAQSSAKTAGLGQSKAPHTWSCNINSLPNKWLDLPIYHTKHATISRPIQCTHYCQSIQMVLNGSRSMSFVACMHCLACIYRQYLPAQLAGKGMLHQSESAVIPTSICPRDFQPAHCTPSPIAKGPVVLNLALCE